MISIPKEILKIRQSVPLSVDQRNNNRYRVVTNERDGTQTAYYFSTPIYNDRTQKILDMKYHIKDETIYSIGSNSNITITNSIRLDNQDGYCVITLSSKPTLISEHEVSCGNERFYPTANGLAIRSLCCNSVPFTLTFEISKPFLDIRSNNKYFALMSKNFQPFLVVSCIGSEDANGNIIAPVKLSYQKITDRKFTISFDTCTSLAKSFIIEANLYEPKLFQDTTVESANPKTNNAFGSVGFIGTTKEFGEQWLYSRPDFNKMPELIDKKILRAILHLPKLNAGAVDLSSYGVLARFCSFGSTWDNKIGESTLYANSENTDNYIDIDLTSILSDKHGRLLDSQGFILKSKQKDCGFSVISTGDSYFYPEILEIVYR